MDITGNVNEVVVDQAEVTVIGRIAKTFGLDGELVITIYDTFPYSNPKGECVFVNIDNIATPLFFASFRRMGKNKAVIVFDDFQSEFRASELIGLEFFVAFEKEEGEPREDGELYMEDLIGYTVRFTDDAREGVVINFIEDKFNPLFELEFADRDIMIPAADDFVVEIDQEKQVIIMKVPEGLLDLE